MISVADDFAMSKVTLFCFIIMQLSLQVLLKFETVECSI